MIEQSGGTGLQAAVWNARLDFETSCGRQLRLGMSQAGICRNGPAYRCRARTILSPCADELGWSVRVPTEQLFVRG